MRHRRRTKYFGVKTAHRKAMFRNMVTSLFRHGRITTTVTRAKELRRVADKLVGLAKEGSLHSRRQALSFIMDKGVVAKLFSEIAPKMAERRGGYTRIVRIGPRRGDGAMMCVIELVMESLKVSRPKKKKDAAPEQVAPTVIPEASKEPEETMEAEQITGEGETATAETVPEGEEEMPTEEVSESFSQEEEEVTATQTEEVVDESEKVVEAETESSSSGEKSQETEVKAEESDENLSEDKKE